MGLMLLKKFCLLILLISASLLSTSLAGRPSKHINMLAADDVDSTRQASSRKKLNDEELRTVHERLLRVNTKDYGRFNPSPSLVKPPFKLIPN